MANLANLPALEGANQVWNRVNTVLEPNAGGVASQGHSPAAFGAFRELKRFLATQKGNPQLRFTAISAELLLTTDDGQGVGFGAATIYGMYLKKRVTNGTDVFIQILDDGTDVNIYAGALTGSILSVTPFLLASDEAWITFMPGLGIANGIRIASTTTAIGTTATTLAASTCDGFMISA
jgi:hypothetical protein